MKAMGLWCGWAFYDADHPIVQTQGMANLFLFVLPLSLYKHGRFRIGGFTSLDIDST